MSRDAGSDRLDRIERAIDRRMTVLRERFVPLRHRWVGSDVRGDDDGLSRLYDADPVLRSLCADAAMALFPFPFCDQAIRPHKDEPAHVCIVAA